MDDSKDNPKFEQEELLKKEAAEKLGHDPEKHTAAALKGRLTGPLFWAVFVVAMGSSFQMGYNIGVVNNPQKFVQAWINDTEEGTLDDAVADRIWSWVVSIFAIGGMIGGLASGKLADIFGRKGAILLNNATAFLAAALMGFSKISGHWVMLLLGRFVIGLNSGLNSGFAPIYLTEVSPVNLRGAIGSCHQLVVTISILVSQILGLEWLFGNEKWWPLLFALTALPAVFQVAAMPFCPETPKYNLINKNRNEQAEKDLKKLRGKEDVGTEMQVMQEEADQMRAVKTVSFADMFRTPWLRWPLSIAVMMMLAQQFSGINVAMYYSTTIFSKGAKLSDHAATYATLGMGTINVLMTVVSVVLVERFGRRILLLVGLAGMWLTTIILVVMLTLIKIGNEPGSDTDYSWAGILAVIILFAFVVSFATGPGSIPWFFVSELFTQGSRGNANSVAVMTNWMANFVVGLIFLELRNAVDQYSFLVFTALLTFFIIYTYLIVPETKNVPIDTIVQKYKDGQKWKF